MKDIWKTRDLKMYADVLWVTKPRARALATQAVFTALLPEWPI